MTFEYASRWFRISVEFFGFDSKPVLRKYTPGTAPLSPQIKQHIVRGISAKVKASAPAVRLSIHEHT